jgi:hypothetical protein
MASFTASKSVGYFFITDLPIHYSLSKVLLGVVITIISEVEKIF